MRTHVLLTLSIAAAVALIMGCGTKEPAPGGGAGDTPVIAQKTCPVMRGNAINPNIYVDYNGRRIYFCCDMCPPKFKADPEKYLKIVDEELKTPPPAAESHEGHTH